jgi:ribosomal protein S20
LNRRRHKRREEEQQAATVLSTRLRRAVEAAEQAAVNAQSSTFRAMIERRRSALCLAIEEQVQRAAKARGHDPLHSYTADEERNRLRTLTKEVFEALRDAEQRLPAAEALKAAVAAYTHWVERAVINDHSASGEVRALITLSAAQARVDVQLGG